jgi:hypothetical protein
MPEMILPGTYIEVRDEGLIRPGPISTGNVGIVGTAAKGRLGADVVYTPSDAGQARQVFGESGVRGPGELTLVRAIELAAANGARRIFAARVAATGAGRSAYSLPGGVTFTALAPGTGYDGATIITGPFQLGLDVSVAGPGGARLESLGPFDRADPVAFAAAVTAGSTRFTAAPVNSPTGPVDFGQATRTDGTPAIARVLTLPASTGAVTLTALEPGAGAASLTVTVAAGANAGECVVTIDPGDGRPAETLTAVPRTADQFVAAMNSGSDLVEAAEDGSAGSDVQDGNATEVTPGQDPTPAVFELPAGGPGQVRFTARTSGAVGNNWTVNAFGLVDVTVAAGGVTETWRGVSADPTRFAAVLNGTDPGYEYRRDASTGGGSGLFAVAAGVGTEVRDNVTAAQTGAGSNGSAATPDDYEAGLDALMLEDVQIVVLAGAGGPDLTAALVAHVRNASTDVIKRERIGVIGSDPSGTRQALVAPGQDEGRLVFVGPGLTTNEAGLPVSLPGTYTAAAVAGLISSLDPHFSPTNKTITAGGLETAFSGTDLEQLVLGRVLVLEARQGTIKVVRGITTSTNSAWAQITTRRIVDFARRGTRSAADPFIGKLNNERVRGALKTSINSLLADMVDREMLTEYRLDVTATRDQEIRGIASVVMVVQPTFSIDYIQVVMYLQ